MFIDWFNMRSPPKNVTAHFWYVFFAVAHVLVLGSRRCYFPIMFIRDRKKQSGWKKTRRNRQFLQRFPPNSLIFGNFHNSKFWNDDFIMNIFFIRFFFTIAYKPILAEKSIYMYVHDPRTNTMSCATAKNTYKKCTVTTFFGGLLIWDSRV